MILPRLKFLGLAMVTATVAWAETTIDVLILYTQPAADLKHGVSGVEAHANAAVASTNMTLADSGSDLRLRLVDVRVVEYTGDSSSMAVDLRHMTRDYDGVMDDIDTWRDDSGADLVALFRATPTGSAWGRGYLPWGIAGSPDYAMSVNYIGEGSYATFAHEVGHNLGAAHAAGDPNSSDPLFSYGRGHRFWARGYQYRTIMAYAPGSRVFRYSNPHRTYRDSATGVVDQANVVRLFGVFDDVAAAYRDELPSTPEIQIQPNDWRVVRGSSLRVEVEAIGLPGMSYQWYYGSPGDTSQPIAGAHSPALRLANPVGGTVWVRISSRHGHTDSAAVTVSPTLVPTQIAWRDQAQNLTNQNVSGELWQEFVPMVDYIDRIDLKLETAPGAGTTTFSIESEGGTILMETTLGADQLTTPGWVSVPIRAFFKPLAQHRLVISPTNSSAVAAQWGVAVAVAGEDPYAAGDSSLSVGGQRQDLAFRIYGVDTNAPPRRRQMTNLSTRRKLAGGDTVIAGFVVNGESPREILLRAVGGSLGAFGVPEVMPDPRLTLYAADGSELGGSAVAGDDEETLAVTTAVGAFGLTDQKDAVLLQTLNPGAYTVHVGAADGRGGEVLTEVYDVTGRSTNGPAEDYRSKAVNLSTRAVLAAEDSLIVGFVVGSDRERTLVLRGIGPTLEAFGVAGALEDPEVEIFNANGEAVALNQDWATTAELEAAMQAAGAFAPLSEREAITMLSLPPGAYTMHVRATSGTAGGDVIAEIYDVTDAGF